MTASRRTFLALAALCALVATAGATPYWTPQDLLRFKQDQAAKPPLERIMLSDETDNTFILPFEFIQTCWFLTTMQEPNPSSPDYGGMHEGETPELWAIVQTDNTQEAIRVWSLYAELTGDLETFRQNIARAWIYTLNFPAYAEEGAPGENYYRVHNCGWGLVAEAKYREIYGETTFLWYADSCARYIATHRLPYTGSWMTLNPLVEGWAAGTLYDYGVEQSDPATVSQALRIGADVQDWIEANPNRLNNNEEWAMSGGTALWGVCRSVFAADTTAGQTWLPVYLPYMDTYAGPGQWNQSWNVWYAHAWNAVAAILHDSLSTQHASALVDTLLDSDNPVDNDGGIMATSTDPVTMDQSWVSCYLCYMGMAPLIFQSPPLDAAALGFLQPDLSQPIAQGQPVPVTVLVGNAGLQAFGNLNVTVSGAYSAQASTGLGFADVDTVLMGQWTPSQPGDQVLMMSLAPAIGPMVNDTASISVHVLGWGLIQGSVRDQQSTSPLRATLKCYSLDYPSSAPTYVGTTDSLTGFYSISVTEGNYRVVVDPQLPYTDRQVDSVNVSLGGMVTVNFLLTPATLLLVDDDGGAAYQQYYTIPLAQAGYDAYWWDVSQMGTPGSEMDLFSGVIWFTGNTLDSVLNGAEQAALASYLNGGGNLFISGQNIAEGLAGQPFLTGYLRAAFVSSPVSGIQVNGIEGDPVTSGLSLLFAGTGGAGNQTSKDAVQAVAPAVESMRHAGNQLVAAVRLDAPYKLLFLSVGLEGATGLAGTTTRQQFLQAVMNWFQIPSEVPGRVIEPAQPENFRFLSLSPNPFNPDVQVRFSLPHASQPRMLIFDALGRSVANLRLGPLAAGEHLLDYRFPAQYSSGVYFFVLKAQNTRIATQGCLVK